MNLTPEELAILAEFGGNVPGMHELDMIYAIVREVIRLRAQVKRLHDHGPAVWIDGSKA